MPQDTVTRELPPGDQGGVDRGYLLGLIRQALQEALDVWCEEGVRRYRRRWISKPAGDSLKDHEFDFPLYGWMSQSAKDRLIERGKAKELLDYLWERGEYKKTLQGPNPDRHAWTMFFVHEIIETPLLKCLERQSVHDAVYCDKNEPFFLSDEMLSEAAKVLVPRIADRTFLYCGNTLMRCFSGCTGDVWELAPDIRLKLPTMEEAAVYLLSIYSSCAAWRINVCWTKPPFGVLRRLVTEGIVCLGRVGVEGAGAVQGGDSAVAATGTTPVTDGKRGS